MREMIEGITAILSIFVILPGIICSFVYHTKKQKREVEKLKYQKELLELEIKKEHLKLKVLEEEHKQLDKIIYEK